MYYWTFVGVLHWLFVPYWFLSTSCLSLKGHLLPLTVLRSVRGRGSDWLTLFYSTSLATQLGPSSHLILSDGPCSVTVLVQKIRQVPSTPLHSPSSHSLRSGSLGSFRYVPGTWRIFFSRTDTSKFFFFFSFFFVFLFFHFLTQFF